MNITTCIAAGSCRSGANVPRTAAKVVGASGDTSIAAAVAVRGTSNSWLSRTAESVGTASNRSASCTLGLNAMAWRRVSPGAHPSLVKGIAGGCAPCHDSWLYTLAADTADAAVSSALRTRALAVSANSPGDAKSDSSVVGVS